MNPESHGNGQNVPPVQELEETVERQPFVILRDTESFLRRHMVSTLTPLLSDSASEQLQRNSNLAEEILNELADINLDQISDWEFRPIRIQLGLSFVGLSALLLLFLLLYLQTFCSSLSLNQQIHDVWYPYTFFVSLGVTGMFLLGREAMR